jgi:hypothetical protein
MPRSSTASPFFLIPAKAPPAENPAGVVTVPPETKSDSAIIVNYNIRLTVMSQSPEWGKVRREYVGRGCFALALLHLRFVVVW